VADPLQSGRFMGACELCGSRTFRTRWPSYFDFPVSQEDSRGNAFWLPEDVIIRNLSECWNLRGLALSARDPSSPDDIRRVAAYGRRTWLGRQPAGAIFHRIFCLFADQEYCNEDEIPLHRIGHNAHAGSLRRWRRLVSRRSSRRFLL